MKIRTHAAPAVTAAIALLAGCGGGGGGIGGTGSTDMGTLHASLTDAPACGFDAVNVTVQKLRVNRSATATDTDAGWSEIVLSPARRVNLLDLTNGVLADLGQTALPAGKYTQMRLVLASNDAADPFANSVVPTGGAETALATPSGTQSGLKIKLDLDVAAGQVADVVLDFDACKSVVQRGHTGQYNLKPVITATPVTADAGMRVVGYVDPAIAVGSTLVSVQAAGVPVKSTVPDATGRFVLYPVPVGSYDLVVTSTGHVTAVMTAVPVTTAAATTVNSAALPIAPASSALRDVAGTVTPATATVRATQTLNGGPTVEVAWGAVDATSGAFAFSLPTQAPVRVAYAVDPVALGFVADPTAAGLYTVEAQLDAAVKSTPIDATAVVPPLSFTLP